MNYSKRITALLLAVALLIGGLLTGLKPAIQAVIQYPAKSSFILAEGTPPPDGRKS